MFSYSIPESSKKAFYHGTRYFQGRATGVHNTTIFDKEKAHNATKTICDLTSHAISPNKIQRQKEISVHNLSAALNRYVMAGSHAFVHFPTGSRFSEKSRLSINQSE